MPTPAFKTDWPTFDAASNTIHDLVKSMGVGEVLLAVKRVIGTFLIERIDNDTDNPAEIQFIADCTRVSDLLERVRESKEVKRVDGGMA
jgi:hypothetical protein